MSDPNVTQKQLDSAKETKEWFDSINASQKTSRFVQLTLKTCENREFFKNELKMDKLAQIRFLWRNKARHAFYYHGTTQSRLELILKEGLKPNELTGLKNFDMSRKEAVYLTINQKEAKMWACCTRKYKRSSLINWNIRAIKGNEIKLKTYEREKAFVIVVPRSKIDQIKLQKDRNLLGDRDFEFHGIIEPPFEFYEVSEEL